MALDNVTSYFSTMLEPIASASFLSSLSVIHAETDNPSSNCPSKLTNKVRRIVHSKLKPFPLQIKTYYLSDANYQTDKPSHTNNSSLV